MDLDLHLAQELHHPSQWQTSCEGLCGYRMDCGRLENTMSEDGAGAEGRRGGVRISSYVRPA